MPGEARTVGSGALDSDAAHRAPRLQPAGELVIAARIGRELRRAQQPPGRVDRGGDMGVFVGVDPAEDSGSVWCHNGDASSGIAAMCATTGRDGAQDTHGVQLKAPIRSRPPDRSVRAPRPRRADRSQ